MKFKSAIAIPAFLLAACGASHDDGPSVSNASLGLFAVSSVNGTAGTDCMDLMAGQHTQAGSVCYSVNGTDLNVTFSTTGDWQLEEAHAWVGCDAEGYPQTRNGNPKIGNL